MDDAYEKIALYVERGKINKSSPFPPDLKGREGADEITKAALEKGMAPGLILEACMKGMNNIGQKFGQNKVFVPDLLMAAKAMTASMKHLKPYFDSGEAQHKGIFVVGTVQGDLHDIGKNLVAMMMKGAGFQVIDLGVDVSPDKFAAEAKAKGVNLIGMSALLTTTMPGMEKTIKALRQAGVTAKVMVGGAPVTQSFADKIGAHGYAPDAASAVDTAKKLVA